MTTTIDIRAICTCSAGELISASTSDSYRAESGLIYQRGSCTVKGINALGIGTPVTFSYQGKNRGGSIKRRLLVLGSSVDGLKGVTNYELGCDLTLLANFREDKVYTRTGVGDPTMDANDARVVTVPLLADSIANAILAKLGLSGSCGLSNVFSVAAFDLSAGYVSVLSDLLQSECKVGYMAPSGGTLIVQNVLGSSSGSAFDATSLIEMQPLSIGPVPAAKTVVSYSTRKLKKPDESNTELLNWEKQESYGVPTTITVDNPVEPFVGGTAVWDVPDSFKYTYTPYTLVETTYDTYDRVVTRKTTERSIVAEVAPSYIQHIAGKYVVSTSFAGNTTYTQRTPPEGSVPIETVSTQSFVYKVKAPPVFDGVVYPDGYEEIEREETLVEEPLLRLTGSTPVYSYAGQVSVEYTYGSDPTQRFVAKRDIRTFETSKGAQGQQLSKTLTEQYLCHAYTQEGQQILADALQKISQRSPFDTTTANTLFVNAQTIKRLGTSVEINSGREVSLQQRPPEGERTANGQTVEASSESETISGTGFGTQSLSLPYAPDDRFIKAGAGYDVIPSDAPVKARAYGQAQNKIRAGMRHGVNIKAAAFAYGGAPGGAAAVSVGGVGVFGLAEGVAYTMDSSGVIVSLDIVPLGTAGSV